MSLKKRLQGDAEGATATISPEEVPSGEPAPAPPPPKAPKAIERKSPQDEQFEALKENIHGKLLDALDLSQIDTVSREELQDQVSVVIEDILSLEGAVLRRAERDRLIKQILDDILGLGPLEPLLNDPDVSDILVNGAKQTYVERRGKLQITDVVFKDDAHLLHVIDRIVSRVGRRIDESSPLWDARLADGSRVNAIIPPLAIDGPSLSIRRFGTKKLQMEDLINFGALTEDMATFLRACVISRFNIIISGGTGSGKTTLLNVLSSFIPSDERIVTIEDSAELQLMQDHVVRLETRPANVEGAGEINQRELVRNCLRMRPDRIIVGEVRSGEALDMLQAMNTGHDGSIATLHANTPRDALTRLETMIAMAGVKLPDKAARQQICSAVDLIVQGTRLSDGSRKISSVSEVIGMEGETITMQEIFRFDRRGVDEEGKVLGQLLATGIRPKCCDRIKACGITLPGAIFEGPNGV